MTLMSISAIFVLFPVGGILPSWIRWSVVTGTLVLLTFIISLPLTGRFFSPVFKGIESILEEIGVYWKDSGLMIKVFLCSTLFHLTLIFINIFIGLALNIRIPFLYYFVFVPLISVLSAIPISFNGIGIREASYIFFLKLTGIDMEKAFAFSLLWFLIVVGASLIGGIIFTFGKFESPRKMLYEEAV